MRAITIKKPQDCPFRQDEAFFKGKVCVYRKFHPDCMQTGIHGKMEVPKDCPLRKGLTVMVED